MAAVTALAAALLAACVALMLARPELRAPWSSRSPLAGVARLIDEPRNKRERLVGIVLSAMRDELLELPPAELRAEVERRGYVIEQEDMPGMLAGHLTAAKRLERARRAREAKRDASVGKLSAAASAAGAGEGAGMGPGGGDAARAEVESDEPGAGSWVALSSLDSLPPITRRVIIATLAAYGGGAALTESETCVGLEPHYCHVQAGSCTVREVEVGALREALRGSDPAVARSLSAGWARAELWSWAALAQRHGDVHARYNPSQLAEGSGVDPARLRAESDTLAGVLDKLTRVSRTGTSDLRAVSEHVDGDLAEWIVAMDDAEFAGLSGAEDELLMPMLTFLRAVNAPLPFFSSFLSLGPAGSGSALNRSWPLFAQWTVQLSGRRHVVLLPPSVEQLVDAAELRLWRGQTVLEWLNSGYRLLAPRQLPHLECTLAAGDVLLVPPGWYSTSLNLEESVAVTRRALFPMDVAGPPFASVCNAPPTQAKRGDAGRGEGGRASHPVAAGGGGEGSDGRGDGEEEGDGEDEEEEETPSLPSPLATIYLCVALSYVSPELFNQSCCASESFAAALDALPPVQRTSDLDAWSNSEFLRYLLSSATVRKEHDTAAAIAAAAAAAASPDALAACPPVARDENLHGAFVTTASEGVLDARERELGFYADDEEEDEAGDQGGDEKTASRSEEVRETGRAVGEGAQVLDLSGAADPTSAYVEYLVRERQ